MTKPQPHRDALLKYMKNQLSSALYFLIVEIPEENKTAHEALARMDSALEDFCNIMINACEREDNKGLQ
jgi:hypothetical protein